MTVYYGMFTDRGNDMVAAVIDRAIRNFWTWPMTYEALRLLARNHPEDCAEATDTVVREMVYDACGFTSDFYV